MVEGWRFRAPAFSVKGFGGEEAATTAPARRETVTA